MKDDKEKVTYKEIRKEEEAKSKDAKINTPRQMRNGIKLMPHDEKTLKTFNFREMNFKDMTNAQKNTMLVIIITLIILILFALLPVFERIFGGVTIGNIRLIPEKTGEVEKDDSSFAFEGDFIVIGNNTSINISGIKFNNFTKGSDLKLVYGYQALEDISDVTSLKIYVEYYNYSKTLLKRFAFSVNDNKLTKGDKNVIEYELDENIFNRAHYVRVRKISDTELVEFPDPTEIEEPEDPNTPTDPTNPSSGNNDKDKNKDSKNKPISCKIVDIDGNLKISQTMNVEFEDGIAKAYNVEYKISSISGTEIPSNYSKYYKKMLKKFKNLIATEGTNPSIDDLVYEAVLSYTVYIDDHVDIDIDWDDYEKHPEAYQAPEIQAIIKQRAPYSLEIKKNSDRNSTLEQLQKAKWLCE